MAITLKKGGTFNLTKQEPGLEKVMIGLGWEVREDGQLDLDASVFMVGDHGKLISDEFFVFYNNLKSPDGAVQHTGDNRTGVGEGDDEMVLCNMSKIHADVTEIVIIVSIHDAGIKAHNFGLLDDAYIRIMDVATKREILRYDLDENYPLDTEIEFGRLRKENGEWVFLASGVGSSKGLQGYVDVYA